MKRERKNNAFCDKRRLKQGHGWNFKFYGDFWFFFVKILGKIVLCNTTDD